MDDVLGYSGRRCIVTGAASGMGEATARILTDLGAEVHAVDIRKPDITGLASYSETDLRDPDAIARTVDAIGGVVNNLFNCAGLPNDFPPPRRHARELLRSARAHRAGRSADDRRCRDLEHRVGRGHGVAGQPGEARRAARHARSRRGAGVVRGASRRPRQRVRPLEGGHQHAHRDAVRRPDRQGHPHQHPQPGPDRHADDAPLRRGQRRRLHARVPEADRAQLAARGAGVAAHLPRQPAPAT